MDEKELLFTELLGCDRATLYLEKNKPLPRNISRTIARVLARRATGEPLPYILGKIEFMGMEFKVTPDVLIPRPDTEMLVEAAVRYAPVAQRRDKGLSILELGTGSGCIAVSLAKLLFPARIVATDISEDALRIAQANAAKHNLDEHIIFIQADLFNLPRITRKSFDCIVSNPPYVKQTDIAALAAEVQQEPKVALDGGHDGLCFYRRIIADAPRYLTKGGFLILEIGFDQCKAVQDLFAGLECFQVQEVIKDYNRIDRVIVARMGAE